MLIALLCMLGIAGNFFAFCDTQIPLLGHADMFNFARVQHHKRQEDDLGERNACLDAAKY